jgi:hypothetical protein
LTEATDIDLWTAGSGPAAVDDAAPAVSPAYELKIVRDLCGQLAGADRGVS